MLAPTTMKALFGFAIALLLGQSASAFDKVAVKVTVNSSSTFGACWDDWCNKPDQFVAFYGDGTGAAACPSTSVPNLIFVGPPAPSDWTCMRRVSRPGRFFVALYDGDGPNGDNTAGQQIDVEPGPALAAMVDVEALARSSPNTPTTITRSGDHGTINFTVSAVIEPGELIDFKVNKYGFQPSTGQQVVFTARATGAPFTRLNLKARDTTGAVVWDIDGFLDKPGQLAKDFIWQGRDASGKPLPPGTYFLTFTAFDSTTGFPAIGTLANGTTGPGGEQGISMTIQPPPPGPSLLVSGTNPADKRWAPESGDLAINVISNVVADVHGEVYYSTTCSGTKLTDLPRIWLQPLVQGSVMWTGPIYTGGAFPLGKYGIKIVGHSGRSPTTPASICVPIEMIKAPKAMVYTQHLPFIATPARPVELTAHSVDEDGNPRIAGRLDVFASIQSVPGSPPPAPSMPVRSCTMASSCTATIRLPPGQSFFSWRSLAFDRENVPVADSGWRGQRVMSASSFAALTDFAVPADISMTGPFMADMRSSATSLDLVYSVSTDFSWTDPLDHAAIGNALDRFMTRLWGIEGSGAPAPTTFLKRPDLVRLYIVPERNPVTWNPTANSCIWSPPNVPWSDSTAVLHNTSCRNNATFGWLVPRAFSATITSSNTIFHELHHSLIGLADEYPSGDGGYFEAGPYPNIYNKLGDCQAVPGRDPAGCTAITQIDPITRMPTGRTYYRLDAPPSDVMVDDGTQQFADVRRAEWLNTVCDAGGC